MCILYFIVGACFGSFISCFAERRQNKISQIKRSHCINCGTAIAPIYLVPIVGYFFSRGHCQTCHIPIPKSLPCFEILGAFVGLLLSFQATYSIHPFSQLLIVSVLLLMSIDDYYTQWIHDSDLLLYSALILFDIITYNELFWSERLLGTCIVALPLLLIHWRFPEALGSGDILFMALSGFYLGVINITYAFFVGIVSALIYSTKLLLQHKATKDSAIPLIPFLSLGVLCMMLF